MTLHLRRPQHETRVEIMPLIDVIFLLLTFFIYAMVLMIRAELLPIKMHAFASSEPATVPPAVTITIDRTGELFFNREPITMARARRVTVSSPDDLVVHADGEVLCTNGSRLECEILPQRLRVLS